MKFQELITEGAYENAVAKLEKKGWKVQPESSGKDVTILNNYNDMMIEVLAKPKNGLRFTLFVPTDHKVNMNIKPEDRANFESTPLKFKTIKSMIDFSLGINRDTYFT